jgi:hypothetical protein
VEALPEPLAFSTIDIEKAFALSLFPITLNCLTKWISHLKSEVVGFSG